MTTSLETANGKPTHYGLGWNLSRRADRFEVWHAGGLAKVSTLLYTRPDRRTVVAILCNLERVNLMDLAQKAADLVEAGE
jgi:hypothetical protein